MSTTIKTILIGATLALIALTPARAETVAKPEAVAVCATCHGENGISAAPIFPNLAGQHRNYLETALRAYRSGARKNAIMGAQAAALTDAQIKQLAAWYAAQKGGVYTVDPEAELETKRVEKK